MDSRMSEGARLPLAPQRTTPAFAFSFLERALQECLSRRRFGKAEMLQVVEFFGHSPPQCVYCGGLPVRRWDHLVAIKAGGETVIGNMVPACATCDDSKREMPYADWMLGTSPGSPAARGITDLQHRMSKIDSYAAHFGYSATSVEDRLTPEELKRLSEIRASLQRLRTECDEFIASFRKRTAG